MNERDLCARLESLPRPRVLIVGDLILDRYVWGTVTSWEPGRRFAQTFTLAHDPDFPSSITVEFEPDPKGCFVWFSHGGWTAGNVAARARFQDWPHLLGRFADLAES